MQGVYEEEFTWKSGEIIYPDFYTEIEVDEISYD